MLVFLFKPTFDYYFLFFEVRKRRRDVAFHIRVTSSSCCSKHGSEKQAP